MPPTRRDAAAPGEDTCYRAFVLCGCVRKQPEQGRRHGSDGCARILGLSKMQQRFSAQKTRCRHQRFVVHVRSQLLDMLCALERLAPPVKTEEDLSSGKESMSVS